MKYVCILAAGLLLTASARAQSGDVMIDALKPLHLSTPLDGKAAIVTGEACAVQAAALQQRIERTCGVKLPIVDDADAVGKIGALGHIVALGHFGNNRVLRHFYMRWYLIVDALQPGVGGYVLQTVHNPDGIGANLVVVGGSDVAGVQMAGDRLIAAIEEHGPTLPRLMDIQLGRGKEIVEKRIDEMLDPDFHWPSGHPMEIHKTAGEAAMLYLYSGDERMAIKFKERLMWWLGAEEKHHNSSDEFYHLVVPYDMVEEAPIFTDDERLWITQKMLKVLRYYWSPEEISQPYFMKAKDKRELRHNHRARYANTMYFGGRYFDQYYDLPEARQWMAGVKQFFDPQMTSFAVLEGTPSMAHITLNEAVVYAAATQDKRFLSRDILGMMCRKGFLFGDGVKYAGSHGNSPRLWWTLAAHLFDDPSHLRLMLARDPHLQQLRLPWTVSWEMGRSFFDGRVGESSAKPIDQVIAMPLDQLYYEQCRSHGPRNVDAKDAFDLIVFQQPNHDGRPNLQIGGHNTGSYSADVAGNLIFSSHGVNWFDGGWWIATTRNHTSVSIVRNGKSETLPAFAKLVHTESTGDTQTAQIEIDGHNGTRWQRSVISAPGKWFLVLDKVTAQKPGDYVIETRWGCRGPGGFEGDPDAGDYVMMRPGVDRVFRLTGAGWQHQYMLPKGRLHQMFDSPAHPFPRSTQGLTPDTPAWYMHDVVQRWAGKLEAGRSHTIAHLFFTYPRGQVAPFRLDQSQGEFVVIDNDVPAADRHSKFSHETNLNPRWQRTEDSRIHAAAAMGDRLAIGLADHRVRVIDVNGKDIADAKMPGKVYALTTIDDKFIAGTVTGAVHAFDRDGNELWQWQAPPWEKPTDWREGWGSMRTTITHIQPADVDGDGKPEILAAGAHWYVLGRRGSPIFNYTREGAYRAWTGITRENTFELAPADYDGDGCEEIAGHIGGMGSAGGSHFLCFYRVGDDKPLWQPGRPPNRYGGSALTCATTGDVDGDGSPELVIGSEAYINHLGVYNLKNKTSAALDAGSGVTALACADINGDGRDEIIAATEMGQVIAMNGQGEHVFLADVHESVTAMLLTGDHIWIGTANGLVFVLGHEGNIVRRGRLPGYLDHLVATDGGGALATTSDGQAALYPPVR